MCQRNGIQDNFSKYPAIVPWEPVIHRRYNLVCHQSKLYCISVSKHLSMELHSWQWDDIERVSILHNICIHYHFLCKNIFFLAKNSIILFCQHTLWSKWGCLQFLTFPEARNKNHWRMWRATDRDPKTEFYKLTDKGKATILLILNACILVRCET